jgi:hypothetical protein
MADATELIREIKFDGATPVKDGYQTPENFLRLIAARKARADWSDERAVSTMIATFTGDAATWFHDFLPLLYPTNYATIIKDYNIVVSEFKKRFKVITTDPTAIKYADLKPQRKTEETQTFINRVGKAVRSFDYVRDIIPDPPEETRTRVSPEVRAALTDELRTLLAEDIAKMQKEFHTMAVSTFNTEMIKYHVMEGLSDGALKTKAWEFSNKRQLAEFCDALQECEARLTRQRAGNGDIRAVTNGRNGNGRIHAVDGGADDDDADQNDADDEGVAYVKRSTGARKKTNGNGKTNGANGNSTSNGNGNGNRSNGNGNSNGFKEKRKLICNYCHKRFHVESECRKKLRDLANASQVSSAPQPSQMDINAILSAGNANGAW